MQISGIDHVVIKVADLDRSIRFYCDVLGCTLEWRRDEIALAHLRVGSAFVDLLASPSMPSDSARNMDHLCLTVADFDVDHVRRHLQDHGIVVGAAAERFGASGWGQSLYVTDPDGNGLELRG
jgi:catechol 2,3-dioxygenase-like lactoylglutathione lyase family enzyme